MEHLFCLLMYFQSEHGSDMLEMRVSKRKGKAATRSNASTSDEENQWEMIDDLEDKVELLKEQKEALEESLKTLEEDLKDIKKD